VSERTAPDSGGTPDSQPSGGSEGDVRRLLKGRGAAIFALVVASISGGVLEAAFLVAVTRSAFAITDGEERFGLVAGIEVSVKSAITLSLVLVVARVGLSVFTAWQSARLSMSVVGDIRRNLAGAFLASSWAEQHGDQRGRLQELLTSFVQQGAGLVTSLTALIVAGGSLAALLVSAVAVDPLAALVVIVAVVALGSVLRPLRAAVKRQARQTATTGMSFATALNETSQLGMEMHVFNVQSQAGVRIDGLIGDHETASRKLSFLRQLVPAIYTAMAYVALVGALAIVATFDTAEFTSVGAVMLIMLRSLSYGQAVQTSIATIGASLPFLGSLDDELDRYGGAAVIDHGQPIGQIGALQLQDVSFEYVSQSPVLHRVSCTIEPCEVVGVVGPSGSGKSTLVQLLLGLRSPTSGVVLADGRDIAVLSRTEWARKVTFVPQQAHLISGTVADNIRFFRNEVSDEQVTEAAKLANLHEEVLAMAGGYSHQVGEAGSHLSGGQQQRLTIARALVESPDALILDEPTSSLDVRSESLIRNTLGELRERMTVIIIAHRLSTLDICDRIMVIQDGELRAFDTPAHLEKDNDFFREALTLSGLR
jgi:ABC-type multidrug transport system fused ATPase/permease subunit